jgi:hydroxylamine reductase
LGKTKMKITKITKNTNMNQLLMEKPELAGLLLSSGMGCIGCPMAEMETIEDGCKAHGMSDKEIEKFIEKLNKRGGKRK